MLKEELHKVVKIRRVNDSLMTVEMVFEVDMLEVICEYAP